jgi:starch phosphorylase
VFEVEIVLNDLDANSARVEIYVDGINGGDPVRVEMKCAGPLLNAARGCVHQAIVPSTRPAKDYTARVMPQHFGVAVPLDSTRILWQR